MSKSILEKIYKEEQKLVLKKYLPYVVFSLVLGIVVKFKLFDRTFLYINSFINILNETPYDHSSLFSTSAAILTTILSIIFVLFTVFVQMSDKYTSPDIFQSYETKTLILLYLGTVILSLMMLETNCCFPTLILTLTFICILSIYPFLQSFSTKFVYEVSLDISLKKISGFIASDDEKSAIKELMRLEEVSKRVIKEDRLQYFLDIISFYANIREAKQKNMNDVIEGFGNQYINLLLFLANTKPQTNAKEMMFKLLIRQIQEYMSSYSGMIKCERLELNMYLLKETGKEAVSSGFNNKNIEGVVNTLHYSLTYIHERENVDYKEELEKSLIEYMGEIAEELFNNQKMSPFKISLLSLWEVGVELYKENEKSPQDSSLMFTVIEHIYEIEQLIGDNIFEETIGSFGLRFFDKSDIHEINNKFKKYYDEIKIMTTISVVSSNH